MSQFKNTLKELFDTIRSNPRAFLFSLLIKAFFVLVFLLVFSYFFQKILFTLAGAVQVMQSDGLQIQTLSPEKISPQTIAQLQQLDALFGSLVSLSFTFYFSFFVMLLFFGQIDLFIIQKVCAKNGSFFSLLKKYFFISLTYTFSVGVLLFCSFLFNFQNTFGPVSLVSGRMLMFLVLIAFLLLTFMFLCACFSLGKTSSAFYKNWLFLVKKGFVAFLLFLFIPALLLGLFFSIFSIISQTALFVLFTTSILLLLLTGYEFYLCTLATKTN